jgi:formate hydrogenlyase subunit 3/multisubunit Na+/H+ antiporter MnhD subunit
MGLVAATLGAGLAATTGGAAGAAALYAAHHGLAKGGLFLAAGVVVSGSPHRRAWAFPLVAVLALSLAGLPLTGGMIAKLALKEPLGSGLPGVLSTLSAIASTTLMLHFLAQLRRAPRRGDDEPAFGAAVPWLVVTIASVLVPASGFVGDAPTGLAALLDRRLLWDSLWPVLTGAALTAVSWRWIDRAPVAPEGDLAAPGPQIAGGFSFASVFVERAERVFRRWPAAAATLLAIGMMLAGTGFR